MAPAIVLIFDNELPFDPRQTETQSNGKEVLRELWNRLTAEVFTAYTNPQ